MKTLVTTLAFTLLASSVFADIQDPPSNDYGPTRKLARGLANIAFGSTEVFHQFCLLNEREGNAASSYGLGRGLLRYTARIGYGIYEVATFPFATTRSSYRPPYKPDVPWIHGGYEEWPPELGFETRYRYTRVAYGY